MQPGTYTRKPQGTGYRRANKDPAHRALFEHNKKIILATQSICAICGQPVDKTLKYPNPMCGTADHIIPIARGGDPSALDNLQLAHMRCNRLKSDKLPGPAPTPGPASDPNRILPQTYDWKNF
jgi:5-methylcytosine-specific restriction endonuclease McrA